MKNSDCLFSDIQNLCNAMSDWLIQKINNPIETNETISCSCCHIVNRPVYRVIGPLDQQLMVQHP